MNETLQVPIGEQEHLKEFFKQLNENGQRQEAAEFSALVTQLSSMEQQYSAVLSELQAVRGQLDRIQDKGIKSALLKGISAIQGKVTQAMSKPFEILIDSHSRYETGEPGGVWLPMPATAEQLHDAMKSVGITADNPQDFFINGFANTEDYPFDVPLEVIQRGSVDELNYLGKLLEMQGDGDREKFTAAVTHGAYAGNLKDLNFIGAFDFEEAREQFQAAPKIEKAGVA